MTSRRYWGGKANAAMYRYQVPVDDEWHTIHLHAEPVAVANNPDSADVVDFYAESLAGPDRDYVTGRYRQFRVFGTGQPLPDDARHVGTAPRHEIGVVWHLYELPGPQGWG